MRKKTYFAPQSEVEYFSIRVDGKKFTEILPYRGESRQVIDDLKQLEGVAIERATAEDYIRNNTCTTLHKRIVKCFIKHRVMALHSSLEQINIELGKCQGDVGNLLKKKQRLLEEIKRLSRE